MIAYPVISQATAALKTGANLSGSHDADAIARANSEVLTMHELIAHRIFQILVGAHRGRLFTV